jgi:hypothetical protein
MTRPQRQIATNYNHTQSTPASTWTINHNLYGYPIVDIFILSSGVMQKIIPLQVTYVNNVTCTVTFTTALAGFAVVA